MIKVKPLLTGLLILTSALKVTEMSAFAQIITLDTYRASFVGSWSLSTSPDQYGANYRRAFAGSGAQTATWSTNITVPGVYNISAWWVISSNRAFDAPYTIYSNGVNLGTVRMNQRLGKRVFNLLGAYALEVGTVKVVLTDTPSGVVTADAIRLTFVGERLITITSPADLALKTSPNVLVTASALRFPAGWGVEFVMDSGNVVRDYSPPFAHTFSGLSKAEHSADAYMVDGSGSRQSAFYDRVNFGVGDSYVAFGDSITKGSHDNIFTDNISVDGRNSGGGYPPILNNLLTINKGYPHSVANEGVSGETSLDGLNRLSTTLYLNPDSKRFLICFGRNDSFPSGKGLSPGETGYNGSFKYYMQQIINRLDGAGKTSFLAKIPLVLANCATCAKFPNPDVAPVNILYKEYNMVVDELATANNIQVVPPDFYAYFLNHRGEFASDKEHFTGVGYQSMADLWFDALTAAP